MQKRMAISWYEGEKKGWFKDLKGRVGKGVNFAIYSFCFSKFSCQAYGGVREGVGGESSQWPWGSW